MPKTKYNKLLNSNKSRSGKYRSRGISQSGAVSRARSSICGHGDKRTGSFNTGVSMSNYHLWIDNGSWILGNFVPIYTTQLNMNKYIVICRNDRKSDNSKGDYSLATRTVFDTAKEAAAYASGISMSREPFVVAGLFSNLRFNIGGWQAAKRAYISGMNKVVLIAALLIGCQQVSENVDASVHVDDSVMPVVVDASVDVIDAGVDSSNSEDNEDYQCVSCCN